MTDEHRHLIRTVVDHQEYFISVVTEDYYKGVKHRVWLLLVGLIETRGMISINRNIKHDRL